MRVDEQPGASVVSGAVPGIVAGDDDRARKTGLEVRGSCTIHRSGLPWLSPSFPPTLSSSECFFFFFARVPICLEAWL